MRKFPLRLSMALAIVVSCSLSGSRALASAIPGDTVDVDVVGFDSTTGQAGWVVYPVSHIFGTIQTFSGAGANGQDVTISSSETIGATTTTDTFLISVLTNFVSRTDTYNELEFDINYQPGANDPLNLSAAIDPSTLKGSGYALYGTPSRTLNLSPSVSVANGTELSGAEYGIAAQGSLYPFGVKAFSLSFTYANPAVAPTPEPSSLALLGTGAIGLIGAARRRFAR